MRLFVYGSLKRGGPHHQELRGAPFLGDATTGPGYALVPLVEEGGDGAGAPSTRDGKPTYLALVERQGAGRVVGELFEVGEPLLPLLDEFEGKAYRRAEIPVVFRAESGFALAYLQKTR